MIDPKLNDSGIHGEWHEIEPYNGDPGDEQPEEEGLGALAE